MRDRDQPPFPRSTRDGFACRAADVTAGLPLTVIGLIRAGETGPIAIAAGRGSRNNDRRACSRRR